MMHAMSLAEILLLAVAALAAAPHYARAVRATAAGSLQAARSAFPPERDRR